MQLEKQESPMLKGVEPFNMTIEVNEVQFIKQLLPKLITPFGIVIEFNEVHPEKQ